MYCIFIFQFPLPGTWAGPSRRIFSSAPLLEATASVLCVFVSLPHFAPKSDTQVNTLGEGALSTAPRRSSSTGMNRTFFSSPAQHRVVSARAVDFLLIISCPLLVFFPPTCSSFPGPYSKKHLNFLIWSCRLGEENTTTFRGLVEKQLEVHTGCLQPWLQEL